jgi:hypothetical protein
MENLIGLVLTRHETTITRIGCNICDSPKIFWTDKLDKFHLCEECKKEFDE